MTTEKVVEIYPGEKYYAKCPECNSTSWGLLLNGLGDGWDKITGTECLNPDCSFSADWIQVDRAEESVSKKVPDKTEKVVHIKDGAASIQYLQELIEGIRENNVTKFICISQADFVVPENCFVSDVFGNKLDTGEKFSGNSFYFFGNCPVSHLVGLSSRMTHILNQSMDGIDVYGNSSIEEED